MKKILLVSIFFLISVGDIYAARVETYSIRKVLVSEQNFVFLETRGTIFDSFEEEKETLSNYVLKHGLSVTKTAILFLDSYPAGRSGVSYLDVKNRPEVISKEYMYDTYGAPALDSKRRVLVGVLVFPSPSIELTSEYHVYSIRDVSVELFQSIIDHNYTEFDLAYDRMTMFNYMDIKGQNKYIGMMEIEDKISSTMTFMSIEGNKTSFINSNLTKQPRDTDENN